MNKRFVIQERTNLIDDIEELTEEEIEERKKQYEEWRKTRSRPIAKVKEPRVKSTRIRTKKPQMPAVQCSGVSKKGLPCQNRTKNPTGYCHHH